MSADGHVIAGNGLNPNGIQEVFVAYLDPLNVPEPTGLTLGLLTLASVFSLRGARRNRRMRFIITRPLR